MLTKEEIKAIEIAAYGKTIAFRTRHHWILTWIEEQPGKNLADKLWNVVNRAYQADYAARGRDAYTRYCRCLSADLDGQMIALSEAMEGYARAGDSKRYDELHQLITNVGWRKVERDGTLV